jgi:SH3-like domain-containing protein
MAPFPFSFRSAGKSRQIEFLTDADFIPEPEIAPKQAAAGPSDLDDGFGQSRSSGGVMPYLFAIVMAFCAVGVAHWLTTQVLLTQPPVVDERALAGIVETAVTRATKRHGLEALAAQVEQLRHDVDGLMLARQPRTDSGDQALRSFDPDLTDQAASDGIPAPISAAAPPATQSDFDHPYQVLQDIFYRAGPSMSDRYLGKLLRGEEVVVAQEVDGWYHFVRGNGEEGFVRVEWLRPVPGAAPLPMPAPAETMALDAGAPAPTPAVVAPLAAPEPVPVPPNGAAPAAPASELAPGPGLVPLSTEAPPATAAQSTPPPPPAAATGSAPPPTPSAGLSVYVATGDVDIRSGPGTSNEALGVLHSGQKVTVLAEERGWYRFRKEDGEEGWVYRRWLEAAG